MRTNIIKPILLIAFTSLAMSACDKGGEPAIPVEQELITTVKLLITDNAGFNKTFAYKVENGLGATTPGAITKDDVLLSPNKEYNVEVQLWNDGANPADNITEEVISESNAHLFLFESTPAALLTFVNGSKDAANMPFNQRIVFKTGEAGGGELSVVLKHNPTNKAAQTTADAGGETDVDVSFHIKLQ
ncbi:hypothetical protein [Polluticoccus soli]|uniref:hypothetical protein n=1 Tax=Polluticoccus soli TaxID=3034150 RepID=UPI0023E231CF|nr:hypothetical protein [Flavipsychrobacter sp. JY13-12]